VGSPDAPRRKNNQLAAEQELLYQNWVSVSSISIVQAGEYELHTFRAMN
jgi:hypothetical protein